MVGTSTNAKANAESTIFFVHQSSLFDYRAYGRLVRT